MSNLSTLKRKYPLTCFCYDRGEKLIFRTKILCIFSSETPMTHFFSKHFFSFRSRVIIKSSYCYNFPFSYTRNSFPVYNAFPPITLSRAGPFESVISGFHCSGFIINLTEESFLLAQASQEVLHYQSTHNTDGATHNRFFH